MADKKGWGSTVAGWFVEPDPSQSPESNVDVSDIIDEQLSAPETPSDRESSPQDESAVRPPAFVSPPPPATGGNVDFPGVFAAAGVDTEEQERVSKATDLVRALPAGTDKAIKKQIVEASLKAFGVPIEKIIEAGVAEIQALEGYIKAGASDTTLLIEESEKRIAAYTEQIQQIRGIMTDRVAEQQGVIRKCNDRKLVIQEILEFFGQDAVARVVKESPKLYEPSSSPQP